MLRGGLTPVYARIIYGVAIYYLIGINVLPPKVLVKIK